MRYIVHNSSRIVIGIFSAEADAQRLADRDAGHVLRSISDVDWDAGYDVGMYVDDAGMIRYRSAIDGLITTAHNAREQLLQWYEALTSYAPYHLSDHRALVADLLVRAHEGLYLITQSDDYTVAGKISFCQQLSLGPAGITSPSVLYAAARALTAAQKPTGPAVWVTPSNSGGTWTRVSLSQLKAKSERIAALSGTVHADTLATAAWIDSLI